MKLIITLIYLVSPALADTYTAWTTVHHLRGEATDLVHDIEKTLIPSSGILPSKITSNPFNIFRQRRHKNGWNTFGQNEDEDSGEEEEKERRENGDSIDGSSDTTGTSEGGKSTTESEDSGDSEEEGSNNNAPPTVVICHIDSNTGLWHTISINETAFLLHQGNGGISGACNETFVQNHLCNSFDCKPPLVKLPDLCTEYKCAMTPSGSMWNLSCIPYPRQCTQVGPEEVAYDCIPETGECLPRCVNESKVCSGGELCTGECLECVDEGTTMNFDITVQVGGDVTSSMFSGIYGIETVTGLNETEAREQLFPILRESYPELFDMLGKELTYSVCMKNVNWLNDPNPNSSQRDQASFGDETSFTRYKKANVTGNKWNGYSLEYCLTSNAPDFFGTISGGIFDNATGAGSPPMAFKVSSTRFYDNLPAGTTDPSIGECTKNIIQADFLTARSVDAVFGGGAGGGGETGSDGTGETDTQPQYAPYWFPIGPDVQLTDLQCHQDFTVEETAAGGRFIELPGENDIYLYEEESIPFYNRRKYLSADLFHQEVESIALDSNKTMIRFSAWVYPKFMRIHNKGCVVQPIVCHHDLASDKWYDVKMSLETSKAYIANGDIEGSCGSYHVHQQICQEKCPPPGSCMERTCSVDSESIDGWNEYQMLCSYDPVECQASDLGYTIDNTTVKAVCDTDTNQCIAVCRDSGFICDDGNEEPYCVCHFCRPPRSMLLEFKDLSFSLQSSKFVYYTNYTPAGFSWTDPLGFSQVEALKEAFPEAFSLLNSNNMNFEICLRDVKNEWESLATHKRDYASAGPHHSVEKYNGRYYCPNLGYTFRNHTSSTETENAYFEALEDGMSQAVRGGTQLAAIPEAFGQTLFKVNTENKIDSEGQCSERIFSLGFTGFVYDGFLDTATITDAVLASHAVHSGNKTWFPLPEKMGTITDPCLNTDMATDADGFIVLPGPNNMTFDSSVMGSWWSFTAMICNDQSITTILEDNETLKYHPNSPCLRLPQLRAYLGGQGGVRMIPGGC